MSNNSVQLFLNLISVFEVDQNGSSLLAGFNTAGKDTSQPRLGEVKMKCFRISAFQC